MNKYIGLITIHDNETVVLLFIKELKSSSINTWYLLLMDKKSFNCSTFYGLREAKIRLGSFYKSRKC